MALTTLQTATACVSAPAQRAGSPTAGDAAATRLAEAWFARSYVEVLEGYGLDDGSVGFGLARKWHGEELRLLLYVVQPDHLDEVAYLLLRRPGAAEVFTYATPQLYETGRAGGVRTRTVVRVTHLGARWGLGAAADLATRLVEPVLPGDFEYRDAGSELIEGETCRRIDAQSLRGALRGATRVELAISERSGVALRTVYYAGDRELARASVALRDVEAREGGALPRRWHLEPAGEAATDLVLRNRMTDVSVPDDVFTRHGLETQRFPKF